MRGYAMKIWEKMKSYLRVGEKKEVFCSHENKDVVVSVEGAKDLAFSEVSKFYVRSVCLDCNEFLYGEVHCCNEYGEELFIGEITPTGYVEK